MMKTQLYQVSALAALALAFTACDKKNDAVMYDGKSHLLIKNPINRYLINSPILPDMKMNEDGSLTLYIQKDNPGPDKEANWLPAPDGPPYLIMRMYWPKTEAPSILPAGSGSWSPPGVVKAK
jgi:hypothetical protein